MCQGNQQPTKSLTTTSPAATPTIIATRRTSSVPPAACSEQFARAAFFSDATLGAGDLVAGRHYLRELSSPKPHHAATYSTNGRDGGEIAGRKFYYHHKQPPAFFVPLTECTERSSAVDEHAPEGTMFSFQVQIINLARGELGGLLLALELEQGLGHKLGMGKAIGLGSARIEVDVGKAGSGNRRIAIGLPTRKPRAEHYRGHGTTRRLNWIANDIADCTNCCVSTSRPMVKLRIPLARDIPKIESMPAADSAVMQ